jgi:hypothetical protein
MDNVAYDVFTSFPLPPPNDVWGTAKNAATGSANECYFTTTS